MSGRFLVKQPSYGTGAGNGRLIHEQRTRENGSSTDARARLVIASAQSAAGDRRMAAETELKSVSAREAGLGARLDRQ